LSSDPKRLTRSVTLLPDRTDLARLEAGFRAGHFDGY